MLRAYCTVVDDLKLEEADVRTLKGSMVAIFTHGYFCGFNEYTSEKPPNPGNHTIIGKDALERFIQSLTNNPRIRDALIGHIPIAMSNGYNAGFADAGQENPPVPGKHLDPALVAYIEGAEE